MPIKVAVPRETEERERRVALVPAEVAKLVKQNVEVLVEKNAGDTASFDAAAYMEAGAKIVGESQALYAEADIVVKVQEPNPNEIELLREGSTLLSFLYAQEQLDLVRRLNGRKVTVLSMNAVPRITRAQSMDALSSMSTLAGYKAVLVGAAASGKILPMLVTAAGTIPPAKALILGAGVAGLQAIATARRLGAIAFAFDVRAAVKEQVESLGAQFVEADLGKDAEGAGGYAKELSDDEQARNLATIASHIKDMDLVISTALIPGRPAPLLITKEMLAAMKPGAVVVDLAAEKGGNCAVTRADETVVHDGVTVLGPTNLPSTIAVHASQMYSRNVSTFLKLLIQDGEMKLNFEDEIIDGMCIAHQGDVRHAPTRELLDGNTGDRGTDTSQSSSESSTESPSQSSNDKSSKNEVDGDGEGEK